MPVVETICPNCQSVYHVPPERLGREVACSNCKSSFVLTASTNGSERRAVPTVSQYGSAASKSTATVTKTAAFSPKTSDKSSCESTDNGDLTSVHSSVSVDRFEILGTLGEGAFGTVYKARDRQLDRLVALKVPKFGVLGSSQDAQRFLREARAAGNLRHPHIVAIYDAGQMGQSYFIASEFIEGQTLEQLIDSGHKFSHQEAATLIQKLALALHYSHSKNIVHRDVKPGNVMMDAAGEPLIMDFGLARREESNVLQTQKGSRMGTPAYMSPEQHAGQTEQVDGRSDQWALGVMLYELLTGKRPFQGTNAMQLGYSIRETEPELPSKLKRRIDKDIQTICLKCLEKDPLKRYQSCEEFAADFSRWLHDEPIHARSVQPVERFARWCRRNPLVAGLSTAVVLVMAAGTVVSSYYALEAGRRAQAEASASSTVSGYGG